jgi:hypothetical protein
MDTVSEMCFVPQTSLKLQFISVDELRNTEILRQERFLVDGGVTEEKDNDMTAITMTGMKCPDFESTFFFLLGIKLAQ